MAGRTRKIRKKNRRARPDPARGLPTTAPSRGGSSRQPVRTQFLRGFCEGATRQEGVRTRQATRKTSRREATVTPIHFPNHFFSKNEDFRPFTDLLYRLVLAYASQNFRKRNGICRFKEATRCEKCNRSGNRPRSCPIAQMDGNLFQTEPSRGQLGI